MDNNERESEPEEETCSIRLVVRTSDFHSDNTGSSPVSNTIYKRK